MIQIDIFSGFLGAGKTTLIKKMIQEAYKGEKLVLIENEFGEIGVDGGFLKEAGIEVNELNSGCICCSLVGDFSEALRKVVSEYAPDRILIEPSGVGKLSDVCRAVKAANLEDAEIRMMAAVVDAKKCKMYMKNFGEFFLDQVESATAIVLSHTKGLSEEKLAATVALLREHNTEAVIVTTDWDEIDGARIREALECHDTLDRFVSETEEHHHHHHEDECDDPECHCHHHDDEHHHEHHHDHEHGECNDPNCSCHHHHADEVFESYGMETAKKMDADKLHTVLTAFIEDPSLGTVLRAKGIVESTDGRWIHFDYVPGEPDVRYGAADVTGRICVIGSALNKVKISELFGI